MNLHHDGVDPSQYTKNAKLANMYNLISTNVDRKGKPFGSTLEGKTLPIYAVQWHPERNQYGIEPRQRHKSFLHHHFFFPFPQSGLDRQNQNFVLIDSYFFLSVYRFEWDVEEKLDKTHSSMVAVQYLANFFVNEARKNHHRFASPAEEKAALIYNYQPTYTGDDTSENFPDQQTYFFNVKSSTTDSHWRVTDFWDPSFL